MTKPRRKLPRQKKILKKWQPRKGSLKLSGIMPIPMQLLNAGMIALIHGKENIKNFYSADYYKTASVKWSPDFIDVAEKGDMAYTYGKYIWQSKDSSGKTNEFKGVFHTVWKKQKDGTWKFVWD